MCEIKTCLKCGSSDFVANGKYTRCKPCLVSQRKARYIKNKEVMDAKNKIYIEANRESIRKHKKKWRDNNKERQRAASREWSSLNKGKVREYNAFRRASLKQATPSWACREEMRSIHELASERGLVVDHIVPLISDKVCGFNTPDNLRCITSELNTFKGNRYWPDMAK